MNLDCEILVGLSDNELEALAEGVLAPPDQARLDELLAQNSQRQISATEMVELDRKLEHVDQLNVLKARARYTLQQKTVASQM